MTNSQDCCQDTARPPRYLRRCAAELRNKRTARSGQQRPSHSYAAAWPPFRSAPFFRARLFKRSPIKLSSDCTVLVGCREKSSAGVLLKVADAVVWRSKGADQMAAQERRSLLLAVLLRFCGNDCQTAFSRSGRQAVDFRGKAIEFCFDSVIERCAIRPV